LLVPSKKSLTASSAQDRIAPEQARQAALEVYAYAQDADPNSKRVKLEVMKMRLYGPGNELLAER